MADLTAVNMAQCEEFILELNEGIDEYFYFLYRIPKGIFSHKTAAYLQGGFEKNVSCLWGDGKGGEIILFLSMLKKIITILRKFCSSDKR